MKRRVFSHPATKININTATIEELTKLPRIGVRIAENIVAYREEHGLFRDIAEFKNVRLIGDKIFEEIKDFITVEPITRGRKADDRPVEEGAGLDE